ncbi:hypothetical protein HDU76_011057, partial [Blyttiomyces sp. JEL0837]
YLDGYTYAGLTTDGQCIADYQLRNVTNAQLDEKYCNDECKVARCDGIVGMSSFVYVAALATETTSSVRNTTMIDLGGFNSGGVNIK